MEKSEAPLVRNCSPMRVAVVCEGPTDWHAIVCFLWDISDGPWYCTGFHRHSAGDRQDVSVRELQRHIPAPAVESTEAWCVGSFCALPGDPELLRGPDLCLGFMTALHRSESRPVQQFAHIDKQPNRRRRYCEKHSAGFERLEAQCLHYRELVDSICGWSDSQ